jgi:hypothetical protein
MGGISGAAPRAGDRRRRGVFRGGRGGEVRRVNAVCRPGLPRHGGVPVAAPAGAATAAAVLLLQPAAPGVVPRRLGELSAVAGRVHRDREQAAGQGPAVPAGPRVHAVQRAETRRPGRGFRRTGGRVGLRLVNM